MFYNKEVISPILPLFLLQMFLLFYSQMPDWIWAGMCVGIRELDKQGII